MSGEKCTKENRFGGRNFSKKNSGGFIALVSVILISAVLLAILLSLNMSSFFTRFNILDSENKKRSEFLAEVCLDTARMNLLEDKTYSGGETIFQGEDSCKICPIGFSVGTIHLETRAVVSSSHTNLKALLNSSNMSILSFEELPTPTSRSCSLP
ncbi:MAG: hypothetical protein PHV42_00135 [Candidatus Pacebacteria bacterium]|nr:hypothetical protein [Candidatus Paceibacterota bacterium]